MSLIEQARDGLEQGFVTSSSSCCGYCNAGGYRHLENTAWQWLSVELQFIYGLSGRWLLSAGRVL